MTRKQQDSNEKAAEFQGKRSLTLAIDVLVFGDAKVALAVLEADFHSRVESDHGLEMKRER